VFSRVSLPPCRYGKHLSKAQVAELVAPHPETLKFVNSWLDHHEIPPSSISITHGGGTLTLKGVPVTKADTLLGAAYRLYRHVRTNDSIVRTVGYALPAVLDEHVLTVAPTTSFVPSPGLWQRPQNVSGFGGAAGEPVKSASGEPPPVLSSRSLPLPDIAVPFLRWLYHTSAYKPSSNQNKLAVVGFLGDYPSPSDLTAFMRKNRLDGVGATYDVVEVSGGGYDPSKPHIEPNFDIQLAEGMAFPTPVTFYSCGISTVTNDQWLPWLASMSETETEDLPQTITISYFSDELSNSKAYAVYVCKLFGQLGARGVSVLFASGDDGVGPAPCTQFKPKFPPSCTCGIFP
jgi:tripeptidyl-peptidase-1